MLVCQAQVKSSPNFHWWIEFSFWLFGAQGEAMSCVRPCVCACVTLFKRTLKMSSRELKQASGQVSRQASKQAGRQASRQASRQAGSRQASRQASTRKAFSRSHALEGLVFWLSHAYKKEETQLNQFKYNKSFGGFSNEKWFKVSGKMWHNKL